jgi:NitT/TauT family transport system substrate-binding protein
MIARRAFLAGVMGLGGLGLMPVRPHSAAAEPPPETTKIRLTRVPSFVARRNT